jgi:hypothetical protein
MTQPAPDAEDGTNGASMTDAAAVEHLVAANQESNRTMMALVDGVRRETVARDRKVESLDKNFRQMQWVTVLVGAAILVMLVVGVFNAFNLAATRKTNHTLLDCVNSTGSCGQANQANQAKILDTVKLYELTVLYCARTNPRDVDPNGDKFIACVNTLYPGAPQLNRQGE